MIKMKELPYPLDALEPYYNRETLDLHYNVLYKGYVDNTNKTQELFFDNMGPAVPTSPNNKLYVGTFLLFTIQNQKTRLYKCILEYS